MRDGSGEDAIVLSDATNNWKRVCVLLVRFITFFNSESISKHPIRGESRHLGSPLFLFLLLCRPIGIIRHQMPFEFGCA
jgi:hypothetical protein